MNARVALSAATRAPHDRLDTLFSAYDLGDRDDYAAFLVKHAAAFLPIEQALTDAGAGRLIERWDEHRRGPLLTADLAALGLDIPAPIEPPAFPTDAAVLGGVYVLEGSRLGGSVLKRQVGDGLPRRFLDAPQDKGRWAQIVATLDSMLYAPELRGQAETAAVATFASFERAAEPKGQE